MFEKEIIEINNQAIIIEKSGFGLKSRREYSAENIKGITLLSLVKTQFDWFKRLPFLSTDVDAFMLWHSHRLKILRSFGKGLSQSDAQIILDTILNKFPQYRYASNPSELLKS